MRIPGTVAAATLKQEGARARYPDRSDARYQEPLLFPDLRPSFSFTPGDKVFTIGSCFARNVERHLKGFEIATREYAVPESEWKGDGRNGILNEYNAGTIAQRVERAMRGESAPLGTLIQHDGQVVDLLLPGSPVSAERALARRREIDGIYAQLPLSDVLIVTLGLVEAWYDSELDTYLNRMPPWEAIATGRYDLVVMDVDEAFSLLAQAFRLLEGKDVLLTVSPVPFAATFSGHDAVVGNAYSKAVLRVCAERLAEELPGVDYFPSFEIVTSGGTAAYYDDNIHVKNDVVRRIVEYMLESYIPHAAAAQPDELASRV